MRYHLASLLILFFLPIATRADEVIDAVVASVNGDPITLSDLESKSGKELSLASVDTRSTDGMLLEELIMQKILEIESKAQRISVSEADIAGYIAEVQRLNNIDQADFEAALVSEGETIETYREKVRAEILKSRLASRYMQSAITVTDDEIDTVLKTRPELLRQGAEVTIRRILIPRTGSAESIAEEAHQELKDGKSFGEVASIFGKGPEAPEGGMLGQIAERDLQPAIFQALFSIAPGEFTDVIALKDSFQIFFLEERAGSKNEEEVREKVRVQLEQQKSNQKLASYFTDELYEKYYVDKKL